MQNLDVAWKKILTDLFDKGKLVDGSRNGPMLELLGHSFVLDNPQACVLQNPRRALNPYYMCAEVLWYFMDTTDASFLKKFAPSYDQYLEPDGTAYWAYGPRFVSQLSTALELLIAHGDTRRCVVAIWRTEDLLHAVKNDKADIPCVVDFQFFIRDNKLHMLTFQRSQDMWVGFPNDIFSFCCIQMAMANSLGVGYGTYTHVMGSCHLYTKHRIKAEAACRELVKHVPLQWNNLTTLSKLIEASENIGIHEFGSMASDLLRITKDRVPSSAALTAIKEVTDSKTRGGL